MYIHFLKNQESFANKLSKKFKTLVLSIVCYCCGYIYSVSSLFNLSYTLSRSGHQALLLVITKRVDSTSKRF